MRGGGGRGGLKGRGRRRSWDWACDGCNGKVSQSLVVFATPLHVGRLTYSSLSTTMVTSNSNVCAARSPSISARIVWMTAIIDMDEVNLLKYGGLSEPKTNGATIFKASCWRGCDHGMSTELKIPTDSNSAINKLDFRPYHHQQVTSIRGPPTTFIGSHTIILSHLHHFNSAGGRLPYNSWRGATCFAALYSARSTCGTADSGCVSLIVVDNFPREKPEGAHDYQDQRYPNLESDTPT